MPKLNTIENRNIVFAHFPLLINDPNFLITSKPDPNYNCIAWAGDISSEWWEPTLNPPQYNLEGVKFNWPFNLPNDPSINTYMELFRNKRYLECNSFLFEAGYKKIALYLKPNTNHCSHASRQLRNGFWTSKLGRNFDIQHSDPTTITGSTYGTISCIMQQIFN